MSSINTSGNTANTANSTNTNNSTGSSNGSTATSGNDLRSLNLTDFLNLLMTELQNQDPLNPMDNSEMVQQLSTIREIGATNQLTESLTNFSVTQQLTTASSLMGQKVDGMTDDGTEVSGVVERVSVQTDPKDTSARKIKVHVGGKTMEVKNIRQILPDGT